MQKIKEGFADITQGVKERLNIGAPKYADNLLGASLQDQCRQATAKDLVAPSEELNSQVVDTINQDVANGKDTKEIASLLKKRLRTDNPHKQWLAVQLVGRVMRDCAGAVGAHTEELLQEVARTMQRPARPDTEQGRLTRQAAKELLRSYGRAGTTAFRAVNRSNLEAASISAQYAGNAANTEAASVVAEVNMLIEQAQANTELLSEMLTAGAAGPGGAGAGAGAGPGGAAGDEFENELTRELVTEVRELRTLFDAYLEQLQALAGGPQGGAEVDAAMLRALEAADMLDGALALSKDVASNQRELEQQAVAGVTGGQAPGQAGGAAAAPAAAAGPGGGDLISLDDGGDDMAMPVPTPMLGPVVPQDPFAASAVTPAVGAVVGSPPAAGASLLYPGAPAPAPAPAPGGYPAPYPAAAPPVYGQTPPVYPGYGAPPPQQPPAYGAPQYGAPPPQYGAPAYGAPPPAAAPAPVPANPNNPFAATAVPSLPAYGSAPGVGGLTPAPTAASNPFSSGGAPPAPAAAAAPPAAAPAPLPTVASGGGGASSVDAEWAMFFAGRTGGGAAAQH
ncbi:hypothetical protein HYH03_004777 [Edaphochlamys debaryana]|uniref:VHS domain-containing protein n=1 Tax=Edaphochlamys debaryana TaxID=47281 RepID=A0A836C2X6_9CHLO|nr:hypothetical protein HYH03_004777 [Edaphochlamys debaryana]|eukprot:KAG2497188.1 hypothetical protein HYH03_004777 [Edaphochlamys debaryana]